MSDRTPYRLRKRPDGRWEIYWTVRRPAPQKGWAMRRRNTKTTDRQEAEILRAQMTLAPEERVDAGAPMTVADACAAYLRHYAAGKGQDQGAARKLRAPLEAFGGYAAAGIKPDDIAHYTSRRMFGRYGKVKVSGATVRAELVILQAALNWALKRAGSELRYRFEKPRDGAPRDHWLDEEQERAILAASEGWPLDVQLFLRLGLTYAARKGAMLDLEFGAQVDFRRRRIDFNKPGALRTRKRRPDGPMTPEIHDLLARRMEQVKGGRVLEKQTPDRFKALMTGIGYGWVTPHVLKHSAITLQLRGGVPLELVSRSTQTAMPTLLKHYRHHSDDELLEAMRRRRT